jgi:hypothetical protein
MTIKLTGPLSINEIYNEFGNGKGISLYHGQLWAKPSDSTTGNFSGGQLGFSTFYGKAKRKIINLVISSSTHNYNVLTAAQSAGYIAGITDLTVTVNNGINVGSTSTATPAFTISGFASGDTVSIVNNGYIVGRGGNGGTQNTNGNNGGNAMVVSYSTSITNNGTIAGGGGGGAGSADEGSEGGYGGGGGAGYDPGSGVDGGSNGTLTTGGQHATNNSDSDAFGAGEGNGGDLGQPGTGQTYNGTTTYGGAAGYYIVGLSNVNFVVTGTRLGQVS